MEYRKILIEMKEQRQQELESYRSLCSEIEANMSDYPEVWVNKRKALLTLELPFKTDLISVNQALKEKPPMGLTLEDWAAHDLPLNIDAYLEAKYKRASFIRFLRSRWPQVNVVNHSANEEEKLDVPLEDFIHRIPCKALLQAIESANIEESSKKVYQSYARGLIAYAKKMGIKTNVNKGIEAETLAIYFNYLEERCLRSYSIQPYKDLIELRLLFYVPIQSTHLNLLNLSHLNSSIQLIEHQNQRFQIPKTFIDLSKSVLRKGESFLKRDPKQLNKFVLDTAKAAGLPSKITPSLIKHSLRFICHSEGFMMESLPLR
jgi:hypothetical protein